MERRLGARGACWLVLIGVLALADAGPAGAAGGAFAVDDSDIGEVGSCKAESWASWADNVAHEFVGVVSPACVARIGVPVEVGVAYTRAQADARWGKDATLKAKITLASSGIGQVGLGLTGAVSWDLVQSRHSTAFINAPVTLQLTEQFKVNLNVGYLRAPVDSRHWLFWGAGFEWNFVKPVTLIAEVFGQWGRRTTTGVVGVTLAPGVEDPGDLPSLPDPHAHAVTDPRAQIGLRLTPMDFFDIDLIYGRNVTGENANWITLGLNVRFEPK